jgi:hypothetical protein
VYRGIVAKRKSGSGKAAKMQQERTGALFSVDI